jgi:hypothetical protein
MGKVWRFQKRKKFKSGQNKKSDENLPISKTEKNSK